VDLADAAAEAPLAEVVDLALLSADGRRLVDSVRELYGRETVTVAEVNASFLRGGQFKEVVGSPTQVADVLQEWFEADAADGFMIFPPTVPHGVEAFVDLVVPELQRRGLHQREYGGTTLREHFGLPRPRNRFGRRVTA
jgi:alkanesulfonate monooxygenase SsuD/methylene tetrahydromethanopterin reductase-like flavin-dependent oxidoreductase (luciferase family)